MIFCITVCCLIAYAMVGGIKASNNELAWVVGGAAVLGWVFASRPSFCRVAWVNVPNDCFIVCSLVAIWVAVDILGPCPSPRDVWILYKIISHNYRQEAQSFQQSSATDVTPSPLARTSQMPASPGLPPLTTEQLPDNSDSSQHPIENARLSALAELEKLATLKEKGIVTVEEFEAKKKELLGLQASFAQGYHEQDFIPVANKCPLLRAISSGSRSCTSLGTMVTHFTWARYASFTHLIVVF